MSEWKVYKLEDIVSFSQGFQISTDQQYEVKEKDMDRFIRIVDYTNKNEKPRYIKKIDKRYWAYKDDVVMIRYGSNTAGKVVRGLSGYIANNMFKVNIIDNNILDKEFLYYFLSQERIYKYLKNSQSSSTMPAIKFSDLYKIDAYLPIIEQQRKVATFLNFINEKTQLNTQINQTLEAIAQAIFKSWFVDFDPVRAKAQALSEGKSEHEANLAAMSVICGKDTSELNDTEYKALWEIADAFPSELVENAEFGEVPKGWEISTIGESYNVIMGQSPSGETYNEQGNGTLFYQGRAEFGWRFPTPRLFTTNPKRMAKSNDILMSVRAPVGDLNVALENCCIGRGLCALSHKSGEFSFGFYQMKNLKSVLDVFNGEGTVFGSINQKDLKSIPVLNPHQEIIALFNKFVFDIDNKIKNNVKENQQLEKIRDLLLPKLLSGELLNE